MSCGIMYSRVHEVLVVRLVMNVPILRDGQGLNTQQFRHVQNAPATLI